jgi:hypothetical protein
VVALTAAEGIGIGRAIAAAVTRYAAFSVGLLVLAIVVTMVRKVVDVVE